MTPTPTQPRSFWPKAIIAYFSLIIVSIVVFVGWAVHQNMDLVRKDYYAEELQFQDQLDRMDRTRQLEQKPAVRYDASRDAIIVALAEQTAPVSGKVHFYRPSDAALDQNVKLSLSLDGSQQIDAQNFATGLWKVRISWKADSNEFFSEETIIINRKKS